MKAPICKMSAAIRLQQVWRREEYGWRSGEMEEEGWRVNGSGHRETGREEKRGNDADGGRGERCKGLIKEEESADCTSSPLLKSQSFSPL